MNPIYTVTLADGTVISDLRMNGNNFISSREITEDVFEDNLHTVTITDGEYTENHGQMQLVQITEEEGEWWFVIVDVPDPELRMQKMQADLDYLAMMTDVDL